MTGFTPALLPRVYLLKALTKNSFISPRCLRMPDGVLPKGGLKLLHPYRSQSPLPNCNDGVGGGTRTHTPCGTGF
jgi:hypothetical protein